MIYAGFAGIGKTTVSTKSHKFIDLESSTFIIDGNRDTEWYKIYCNIVEYLTAQGYNLFICSHQKVREELHKRNIPFTVITPALELRDKWIERLKERYEKEPTEKNASSLKGGTVFYDVYVGELLKEENKIVLDTLDYDLEDIICGGENYGEDNL